jgi:hypothetical protein
MSSGIQQGKSREPLTKALVLFDWFVAQINADVPVFQHVFKANAQIISQR